MDFYVSKSKDLPRFVYRHLEDLLATSGLSREEAFRRFAGFADTLQLKGDWLKLKWCMPTRLARKLSAEEQQQVLQILEKRRGRRNERFLEVFPHCGDEYSFERDFLDAAFGAEQFALISKQTRVFTIGSCFARNIAEYLKLKQFNVTPFVQAEDLNSPFSNAKMLAVSAAEDSAQRAFVERWVNVLYPAESAGRFPEVIAGEIAQLEKLARQVRDSDVIIITCGNIVDYFVADADGQREPGPAVAPKFFSISGSEDIEQRQYLTNRIKKAGAEFRLGTYAETAAALLSQYQALRSLSPQAHLIYTLSPVPIDSAIGVANPRKLGAIELDCISKSSLRTALAEFFDTTGSDARLHYFPSFEIVRWVASCTEGPIFGREDAASRHVSQDVLEGVYEYFLHKYGSASA